MPHLTLSVHFDAPPAQAFEFVAQRYFLNAAVWDPTVLDVRQTTPGRVGLNTTGQVREKAAKSAVEKTVLVSRWEQDRLFELTGHGGQRGEIVRRQYRFMREDRGTRMECQVEYNPTSRTFAMMPAKPPRALTRDVEYSAMLLKRALERGKVLTLPAAT